MRNLSVQQLKLIVELTEKIDSLDLTVDEKLELLRIITLITQSK